MSTAAALEVAGWLLRGWLLATLGLLLAWGLLVAAFGVVWRLRRLVDELRWRRAVDQLARAVRRDAQRWPA